MPTHKTCLKCNISKSIECFNHDKYSKDGYFRWCKDCVNKSHRDYYHSHNVYQPMSKNKECPLFLGVHVAERVLSNVFQNVERMIPNNPGYDFICNKGYKIDVKSSCRSTIRPNTWKFGINNNKIADYFLLLAFNNIDELIPEHFWLIPSSIINDKNTISFSERTLYKWEQYERPIEPITKCCNVLR